MYDTQDSAASQPAPASRRTYTQAHVKLHMMRFGGGLYRATDRRTGLTLGYVERTGGGWLARSKSQTYRTVHPTRAGAVLALASYGRMKACSLRQERFAKATRAGVEADVHNTLTPPQVEAFHRFCESHPRMDKAKWWCDNARELQVCGWEGFRSAIRRDGMARRFMAHYRAALGLHATVQGA